MTANTDRIHKLLGDGRFVFLSETGRLGGHRAGFEEPVRVERGDIVALQDSFELVPPRDRWQNTNEEFMF